MLRPTRWFPSPSRVRRSPTRLNLEVLEHRAVPAVLTPAQVRHAYGFDQISFLVNGQPIKGDGAGQTIAIVDAYDDPNIFGDLNAFDKQFSIEGGVNLYSKYGAATSFLTKVTQGTPRGSVGWGQEISLDVEWAHTIAPAAKIMLVEANTSSYANLFASVDYARGQPGVVAVSMSWGSGEFSTEASYESHFLTPTGHLGGSNGIGGSNLAGGVTFVASSGDSGAPAGFPSVSSKVIAVGGTTLNVDSAGNVLSETGWSGSGGGPSTYITEPSYQTSFQSSGKRGNPDVSYNADPNTGFYVYDSYGSHGGNWWAIGGTSAGSPQWAALVAIADQGRALSGSGSLDSGTQTLPALYNLASLSYSTYFRDITSGNNGYAAGTGYDFVTGLGSPIANQIVAGLLTTGSGGSVAPPNSGGTGSGTPAHPSAVVFSTVTPADASVLFNVQPAVVSTASPPVQSPAVSYATATVVAERRENTAASQPVVRSVVSGTKSDDSNDGTAPGTTDSPASPPALPTAPETSSVAESDPGVATDVVPMAVPGTQDDEAPAGESTAPAAIEADDDHATRLGLAGLTVAGLFLGCDLRVQRPERRHRADRWSVDLRIKD
ncbi:MAG: hypothetical protein ACJ8F7_11670 [Gemmataceae bacterium]